MLRPCALGVSCLLSLVSIGCSKGTGGGLRLKIDALAPLAATSVGIDVSAGQRTKHFDVPVEAGSIPPALEVGLEVSPDSLGAVTVVATIGATSVSGSAVVESGAIVDLTLTFNPLSNDFLTADLASIQFGEVAIGSSSPAVLVTLTNSGNEPSSTLALSSSLPVFIPSEDGCSGKTLAAKAACSFRVAFVPTVAGDVAGSVSIGNLQLAVTGTGVPAGALVSADSPFDFGAVGTGESSEKTFVISNSGSVASGAITVAAISGDAPFQYKKGADSCNGTALDPGMTCSIVVTYQPNAVGTHSASIRVSSPKAGKLTLAWTGQAKPATLNFTPLSHSFGDVLVGDVTTGFEFAIVNNAAAAIGPVAVSATSQFLVGSGTNCVGMTLQPGAGCVVTVQFAPTMNGYTTGTVTLSGAGLQQNAMIPVDGTGYGCTDKDGDGYFVDSGDGLPTAERCGSADCDDDDTDNWDKCATCLDTDNDGFFAGCNRYTTRYAECDADATDETKIPSAEGIGEADSDCDGRVLDVSDGSGIFVAPTGVDSNPGTQAAPVQTLAAALLKTNPKQKAIYLQKGTYAEAVNPLAAQKLLGVFGGFSASWTRDIAGELVTLTPAAAGVSLAVHSALRVDGITVKPPAHDAVVASGRGAMTIANALLEAGTTKKALTVTTAGTRVTVNDSVVRSNQQQDAAAISVADGAELAVNGGSISAASVNSNATAVNIVDSTFVGIGFSLYVDGPTSRRGIDINGVSSSATAVASTLNVAAGSSASSDCATIYQNNGALLVRGSVLQSGSAPNTKVVNVINGTSTRIYSSALIGGAGSTTGHGIFLRNVSDIRIVNNFISQTGTTANDAAVWVQQLASGVSAYVANNIIVVSGTTAAPVIIATDMGSVRLSNNSITGGACAIKAGICAPSVNNCTGISTCFSPTGNIATACPVDSSYHLLPGSACKSVGTDPTAVPFSTGPLLDIDKASRPIGAWDIGPDEVADSF